MKYMKKAGTFPKGIENVFFMYFMISCLPVIFCGAEN